MPFVELNGITMHYHDEGTGTPVVLVNGFSGNVSFYRHLVPKLAEKHRVICFDNRGAGLTEYDRGMINYQDFVDDTLALFDYLGINKAHLLGWSMGAHIAQEFAIQHQDRLISLTLISAYPYRPARSSYFMNGIVDAALGGADPSYISMMTNAFCFTEDYFSALENKGKVMKSLGGLDPKGLKGQMHALDQFDTREKLHVIDVPTLSIHGLDDIMVEPKMGDFISDRIKNCKVIRISGVGHIISPSYYEEDFIKFIESNE